MLPATNAGAFALAAFALIIIPGPSVLFVVGRSLALGRRGGLISVIGNAIGTMPAFIAVALGLGQVIAASLVVFVTIKVVGGLYLVYLGVQAIRHRHDRSAAATVATSAPPTTWQLLRQGMLVGVSNPKTIVFFVAVLPQFVSYDAGHIPLQLLLLGLIFNLVALLSDGTWALTAGTAREWFASNPKRVARMGASGGIMMIGLGGVLVATGNKT